MCKGFLNYFRITTKSSLLTISLLLILDLGLRLYWANLYQQPGSVRLVNSEIESLQTMINEIKKAEGYKIVFLGDSQTYGSAVKDSSNTIPAYLERDLAKLFPDKQIKIFNLAFKGYGISENYFILNSLINDGVDVDLIIYNISTSWFNRNEILEHQNVVELSDYHLEAAKLDDLKIKYDRSFREKFSAQVNLQVGNVWSLYQNRSAITGILLGKSFREKLTDWELKLINPKEALKRQKEEKDLYQPWFSKDWDSKIGKTNYTFGTVNTNNSNPQIIFYKMILNLLSDHEMNAIFYNSPQNTKMIDKYYGIDQEAWNKSLKNLKAITKNNYITYLDYTNSVPDSYFSDTVHLNSRGNELLAKQLEKDIIKNRKW